MRSMSCVQNKHWLIRIYHGLSFFGLEYCFPISFWNTPTTVISFDKFCIPLLPGSPTTTRCKSQENQCSHKLGIESASQGRTGWGILELPRSIWLSNKGQLSPPPFILRRGTSTRYRLVPSVAKATLQEIEQKFQNFVAILCISIE